MTRTLLLVLGLLLASSARAQEPAASEDVTLLRLRDGDILWGAIAAHDEDGLAFRRLDNGGTVRLAWSFLDPTEERELRLALGYAEIGVEEMMVEADRLLLVDGTELVGLIVERTPTELWIKTAEGRLPIPLGRISGPAAVVQVPALDVYTKDELYQRKLFELAGPLSSGGADAAAAHFEVARFAEGLLDYPKALAHYQAVARLDPLFEAETLPATLARAAAKAEVQAQVDLLQEIDLWRARKRYDKALAGLATFPELYPQSPLMEDWTKLRERVAKAQMRDLREEVVRSWHHWSRRLAEIAARKMTYAETMAYLEGQIGEDCLARVQADLARIAPEITPEDVRRLWDERAGGRLRQASYGNGTWILGEDAALAGVEQETEQKQPEEGTAAAARKELEERIERYVKNQEIARKAQAGAQDGDDPEAFWKDFPSPNRAQWILAYYVENSGDFHVDRARFRNCRECGGTGTRAVMMVGGAVTGGQGGTHIVPCPTCHKIGAVRMVKYR